MMIMIASRGYVGESGCGYVEYTNAPKVRFLSECDPGDGLNRLLQHLGSAIWMLLFQVSHCSLTHLIPPADRLQLSIVILTTLVIASDLAWRKSSYNEWAGHYVEGKSLAFPRYALHANHGFPPLKQLSSLSASCPEVVTPVSSSTSSPMPFSNCSSSSFTCHSHSTVYQEALIHTRESVSPHATSLLR